MPMHHEIRHLLPAYCAGSLDEQTHAEVESALLGEPGLLAEAMEMMSVAQVLERVRAEVDAGPRGGSG